MKEPDYMSIMMGTYGTIDEVNHPMSRKFENSMGETMHLNFNYGEVFSNHFLHHHSVDDNNSNCCSPIGLEESWATKCWPINVFAWFLVVTKVNVNKACHHILGKDECSQLQFHNILAKQMLKYGNNKQQPNKWKAAAFQAEHELCTAPTGKIGMGHDGYQVKAQTTSKNAFCAQSKYTHIASAMRKSYCVLGASLCTLLTVDAMIKVGN